MRKLSPLVFFLLWGIANAQTITGSNTVTVANPQVFGRQLGTQNAYDNGQIFKNLFFNGHNAGNEPYLISEIWQIQSGGTLSTTQVQSNINNSNFDGVPANFWVGSTITFYILGAAPGSDVFCTSTVTANTVAQSSPANGTIITFSPACPSAPVAGTHIFRISKTMAGAPGEWFCLGSGTCSYQSADLCGACGAQTLKIDTTGGAVGTDSIFDSSSQNQFYSINGGTWTGAFQVKLASGTASAISMTIQRGSTNLCTFTTIPTASWVAYSSASCVNPSDLGTGTNQQINVRLNIPSGMVVLLDNFDFERTSGGDATNTTVFRDEFVHAQQNYNRKGLIPASMMPPCRYGPLPTSDMADLTQASQFNHKLINPGMNYSPGSNGYGLVPIGLPQFYDFAYVTGCLPYFIFPMTAPTADAGTYIHWITTSGNNSRFAKHYVELGNENWNGIFVSYSLGFNNSSASYYGDYLRRSGTLIQAMRNQATTDSLSGLNTMVGIQTTSIPFASSDAAQAKADIVLLNSYMMNTAFTDSTNPVKWNTTLTKPKSMTANTADPTNWLNLKNTINGLNNCGSSGSATCVTGIYEENLHAYIGSITQAAMDGYTDGRGMGEILIDSLLSQSEAGVTFHNVFAAQQFLLGSQGLSIHLFGDVVDYGGGLSNFNSTEYVGRPQYYAGYMANRFLIGPMVQGTVTSPDSCALASTANDVPAQSLNCERVFFANDASGNNHTMMVLNRDQSTAHTVTYSGSFVPPSGSTVTKTVLTGSGIQDKNEADSTNVTNTWTQVVKTSSSSVTMASSESIPAASAVLYEWTTSSPPSVVYHGQSLGQGKSFGVGKAF